MNKLRKTLIEFHEMQKKQDNIIKQLFKQELVNDINLGYFECLENLDISKKTFLEACHSDCDGHSGILIIECKIKDGKELPQFKSNEYFYINNQYKINNYGIEFNLYFYYRLPDNLY